MKDERRKYIIVDAKDINVTIRGHERVSGFIDFWKNIQSLDKQMPK